MVSDLSVGNVYVSPLTRALETLLILWYSLSPSILPPMIDEESGISRVTVLSDLREIDLYGWEGRSKSDSKEENLDVFGTLEAVSNPLIFRFLCTYEVTLSLQIFPRIA